jgi:hypothetical protein
MKHCSHSGTGTGDASLQHGGNEGNKTHSGEADCLPLLSFPLRFCCLITPVDAMLSLLWCCCLWHCWGAVVTSFLSLSLLPSFLFLISDSSFRIQFVTQSFTFTFTFAFRKEQDAHVNNPRQQTNSLDCRCRTWWTHARCLARKDPYSLSHF